MTDIVDQAKASNGEQVIKMNRVGATPYMRFTPYENARGVTVNMWSCISIVPKAMPERTLLFHPRIVDPSEYDDYNVRMFTTEWVKHEVYKMHPSKVELLPADETPFAGNMMQWVDND
jgi:hypothetical protein